MLNFRKTLREVVYISQLTGVAKKKLRIILSVVLSNLTVLTFPSLSFYSIHARIWELAFGSLLGFIEINKNIKISNFRN